MLFDLEWRRSYDVGERPGVGRYRCRNCGYEIELRHRRQALPACLSCTRGQPGTWLRADDHGVHGGRW